MKYTNNSNLPQGIVDAIIQDEYDAGSSDYTPSSLSTPPQLRRLMQLNYDKITIDVADEIWKLFGTAVHYILDKTQRPKVNHYATIVHSLRSIMQPPKDMNQAEFMHKAVGGSKGAEEVFQLLQGISGMVWSTPEVDPNDNRLIERRLYLDVAGFKIGVKPDWYDGFSQQIEDYKVTSVWKVNKGDYQDWITQLNIYSLVLEGNGFPVQSLQINAILKDWKKFEKGRDENYPGLPVHKISIDKWNKLDTLQHIINKIREHESVKELIDSTEIYKIRPCTDEEKWHQPDKYAVTKVGGKRATAVFNTLQEANDDKLGREGEYYVDVRRGEDLRCNEYCYARDFCAQYKAEHTKEAILSDSSSPDVIDLLTKLETPPIIELPVESAKKISEEVPLDNSTTDFDSFFNDAPKKKTSFLDDAANDLDTFLGIRE